MHTHISVHYIVHRHIEGYTNAVQGPKVCTPIKNGFYFLIYYYKKKKNSHFFFSFVVLSSNVFIKNK